MAFSLAGARPASCFARYAWKKKKKKIGGISPPDPSPHFTANTAWLDAVILRLYKLPLKEVVHAETADVVNASCSSWT
jgi:hypothetical protein